MSESDAGSVMLNNPFYDVTNKTWHERPQKLRGHCIVTRVAHYNGRDGEGESKRERESNERENARVTREKFESK